MGAKDVLDRYANNAGWDDQSKVDLLCRFLDNFDVLVDDDKPDEVIESILDRWLFNIVQWENEDDGS